MTTLNFDLNIKNYTLIELRKLLNLEVPFTENEIMEKTDSIKTKIIRDDTLSTVKKEDIIKFILKAESILQIFQIYVKNSFAGTTPNWSIFNSI